VPDELVESYLRRLAAANRLDHTAFHRWLCGRAKDALPEPGALARVSGYPVAHLCQAMPELCPPDGRAALRLAGRPRPGFLSGPGCACCNAARGAREPVRRWRTHDDVLCRRHRRWTAALSFTGGQPDLAGQPSILAAHRLHRRLIRTIGREPVRTAFHSASLILERWRDDGSDFDEGFVERMRIFNAARHAVPAGDPSIEAALYPRRVALTRLLAHPRWRALALGDHLAARRPDRAAMKAAMARVPANARSTTMLWDGQDAAQERIRAAFLLPDGPGIRRFVAEVRRTVYPVYQWYPLPTGRRRFEPLVQWVLDQLDQDLLPRYPGPAAEEVFGPDEHGHGQRHDQGRR
jgi:hypothetical protein